MTTTCRDLIAGSTNEAAAWRVGSDPGRDHATDAAVRVLSVSLAGKQASLRLVFEPEADGSTPASARRAALATHRALEARHGADPTRLRIAERLFLPEPMEGHFAAYGSIAFARGAPPMFETYLNPQAQGAALAPSLLEEALDRLGLRHAWAHLCDAALRRGPDLDELTHVALDLRGHADARIRVYVRHHAATPEELAAACASRRDGDAAAVLAFARAVSGGDAPMITRAPLTCHTFTASPSRATATVCVPTDANADERAGPDRVAAWLMRDREPEADRLQRVLSALRAWPGEAELGTTRWVALTHGVAGSPLTVSLTSRARGAAERKPVLTTTSTLREIASPEAVITWLMARPLGAHPLLRRIARLPGGAEASRRAAAARHMHEVFADLHPLTNPHEALGALVAGVVAVRLFDADASPALPYEDLLAVARLVVGPSAATAAFARGAMNTHRMFWRAMDAAYPAAFPIHHDDARAP